MLHHASSIRYTGMWIYDLLKNKWFYTARPQFYLDTYNNTNKLRYKALPADFKSYEPQTLTH